jgi:hypothetical protein
MYRHQAASAINPAPSGANSYRSRHSRQFRQKVAKWSVKIPEVFPRASVFFNYFQGLFEGHSGTMQLDFGSAGAPACIQPAPTPVVQMSKLLPAGQRLD